MSQAECQGMGATASAAIEATLGVATTVSCRTFYGYDLPEDSWLLILKKIGSSVEAFKRLMTTLNASKDKIRITIRDDLTNGALRQPTMSLFDGLYGYGKRCQVANW